MTEQETSLWSEIVCQALQKYYEQKSHGQPCAVPGAPLKPLVLQLAAEKGLTYPPQAFHNKKFSDFLASLPGAVLTQRRLGQDLLVVPAGRTDLFDTSTETAHESVSIKFRQDVFKAFTTIPSTPEKSFWYVVGEDAFVEMKPNDIAGSKFISIDSSTFEEALKERKAFVETLNISPDASNEILLSLSTPDTALSGFSTKIKALRLDRRWHHFRADLVLGRLQAWAAQHNIPFNQGWIEKPKKQTAQEVISSRETNAFLAGLMQLGPDDAKRVLVPLDIVLKVLRRE